MKRQAAFEKNGNKMLKGALHCHTTRSDGQGTPEEVIAMHADHGYDFMALTDHRVYNRMNFGDRPMTILPAMEMDCNFPESSVSAPRRAAMRRISALRACASRSPRTLSRCSTSCTPTAT